MRAAKNAREELNPDRWTAREISMLFWSREYCTASSLQQQQQHVRRDRKSCAAPSMMSRVPAPRGDDLQGTKTRVTAWSYFLLDLSHLTMISFWMIFLRLVVCMHARTWRIMLLFFLVVVVVLQLLLQIVTRPLPSPPSSTPSRRCSKQPKTQNPQASKQANKQAEKRDEQIIQQFSSSKSVSLQIWRGMTQLSYLFIYK